MAYMNQELKKKKADEFKKAFPKLKATFGVRHHSTLVVTIKDDDLFEAAAQNDIKNNIEYCNREGREPYLTRETLLIDGVRESNHNLDKMTKDVRNIVALLDSGNHNRSDAFSDYFDVGFYLEVKIFPKTSGGKPEPEAPPMIYKTPDEVINAAIGIMESRAKIDRYVMTSPKSVKQYFNLRLGDLEHEEFAAAFLDSQSRLIAVETLAKGTIDGASVYPREVVKETLKHNAAAVIFAHNHPSGIAEPSRADHAITEKLIDALKLINVRVLDHLIIGSEQISFSEKGWI